MPNQPAVPDPKASGLTMADVLELPPNLRHLTTWMMREREVSHSQAQAYTGLNDADIHSALHELQQRGFVMEVDTPGGKRYRIRMLVKQNRQVTTDLWSALDK